MSPESKRTQMSSETKRNTKERESEVGKEYLRRYIERMRRDLHTLITMLNKVYVCIYSRTYGNVFLNWFLFYKALFTSKENNILINTGDGCLLQCFQGPRNMKTREVSKIKKASPLKAHSKVCRLCECRK